MFPIEKYHSTINCFIPPTKFNNNNENSYVSYNQDNNEYILNLSASAISSKINIDENGNTITSGI